MKHVLKKSCLLWLSLLSIFSVIWFIGVTNLVNGENTVIKTNPSDLHESSLFSLYLSGGASLDSWLNVGSSQDFLSILNWLIIWKSHSVNTNDPVLVLVGWWQGNIVSADNVWIGWWQGNRVTARSAWIGWWYGNVVEWWDGGVVVWWYGNKAIDWGVVLWWYNNNNGSKWVVLWWQNNKAWTNSLVLWQKNVNWGDNSFLWNNKDCNPARGECPLVQNNAVMITASNWVLIWTYDAKPSVALVIDWAIKLWNEQDPTVQWEINSKGWCITVSDKNGGATHVLGKTSESQCDAKKWCQFGKTLLQHGEKIEINNDPNKVKAYSTPYYKNCNSKKIEVTCNDWNLSPANAYPYCYEISTDPRLWY